MEYTWGRTMDREMTEGAERHTPILIPRKTDATAFEGLKLLRAFRLIACPDARARILSMVDAEAQRASIRPD